MNPSGLRGMCTGNNDQNRPSIFTDQYPPPMRPPLNWIDLPGTSQPTVNFGTLQSTGFNMQPQGIPTQPNFQFSIDRKSLGSTVQFPFSAIHRRRASDKPFSSLRCKRKTDSPSQQAAKQFITEEKMAEHLSKLRICSETAAEMESEEVKEQRLYMCEEMKRFQAQSDPIIPDSLLSKMGSPCTALVLWKPPESILAPQIFDYREEDSENNNNNVTNYMNDEEEQRDLLTVMEFDDL